jgi:hypothetical protein
MEGLTCARSCGVNANWDPHDFSLSEAGYLAQTNAPIVDGVAAVDLFCRDYGGKCKVSVDLQGTNGTTRSFTIPSDTDTDLIADCWEQGVKTDWQSRFVTSVVESATAFVTGSRPAEPRDPDGSGGLAAHYREGDGFGAFDEYRGFSLPGANSAGGSPHVRLSPVWKDMVLQVDVAATNGVPAAPPGGDADIAGRVAAAFVHDLGIRLHWYAGAGFERGSHAGATLEAVHSAYAAGRAAAAPPLHTATGVRRLVLDTGCPPQADGTRALGMTDYRCSLVDVGGALLQFSEDDPLHWFFARHGVSRGDAVFRLALHEAGHLAECSGDERLEEAEPALLVRSHIDAQEPCRMWTGTRLGETCLFLRHPLDLGPEEHVVLGPSAVTVAGLAAAINASSLFFRAEVARPEAAGAEACRLVFNPDPAKDAAFPSTGGAWHAVRLEAAVNGVMSYNKRNPEVWKAPAFDNGAADEEEGPRARLYVIEVGAVMVRSVVQ